MTTKAETITATTLVMISACIGWAFVVVYHVLSTRAARREPHRALPWWRSPTGRMIMNLVISLAMVISLPTVARVAGVDTRHSDWFAWLYLVVFTGVPAGLAWLLGMLLRMYGVWPFRGAPRDDVGP